jgi:ribokinase
MFVSRGTEIKVDAEKVTAVDTTGAGDTFIGYFMSLVVQNFSPERCLKVACKAAGICVTRHGAADSIPVISEVLGR